jgi:Domain of unknown function (DUF4399)
MFGLTSLGVFRTAISSISVVAGIIALLRYRSVAGCLYFRGKPPTHTTGHVLWTAHAAADVDPSSTHKTPFRVQFQASGFNVARLNQKEKDTGHFRLTLTPEKGGKPAQIAMVNGQTEVWLSPPIGNYAMTLDLIDNMDLGKTLAATVVVPVRVE